MIIRKSMAELEKMRAAGLLVWKILEELRGMVKEGISTFDLEVKAEQMMKDAGARSAFKGYTTPSAGTKFPTVLCTSVNDEIVHGMPSQSRILKSGDIVSIDTGVQLNGYYGDSAITVAVGEISPEAQKLMEVTRESLELAIEKARPGNRLFDISGAVERHVTAHGFSIVREFVGHGIGTQMHEEPQVPNYVDRRGENPRLKEGMVLAIEPMVNAGKAGSRGKADRWTAVTEDGKYSAHFEHTVAITANGPWVLTRP
jgi:methionyl aminopeptidase